MKIIKAVLFDVDGVLLDTETFQYLAWVDTFKRFAGYDLSEGEYSREYCGRASVWNAEQVKKDSILCHKCTHEKKFRKKI